MDYGSRDIRIVDISLTPRFRDQGLGEYLLRTVIAQSQQRALPVTIHVEHQNPARRLHERLDFCVRDASGQIYLLMERLPVEALTPPSRD